jgi:hypothetical protein
MYISWDMKKEPFPYMGIQKNSTHPLINRLHDRRIGKVCFNQTEPGNLTGIHMGPLHKKEA